MPERYSTKILRFCEENGITVPIGFGRHPASRYVIIELTTPPKLVARTWFKHEDVIYYLKSTPTDAPRRILDFKLCEELNYSGGNRLKRLAAIDLA